MLLQVSPLSLLVLPMDVMMPIAGMGAAPLSMDSLSMVNFSHTPCHNSCQSPLGAGGGPRMSDMVFHMALSLLRTANHTNVILETKKTRVLVRQLI